MSLNRKKDMRLMNLLYLKSFRRELRNDLTPAEARLWVSLKGRQLEGRKFRRQHSIGPYILDFYCPSEYLAVELDGDLHYSAAAEFYDEERTLFCNYYGVKVIRFENQWVYTQPESVLESIRECFGWWIT